MIFNIHYSTDAIRLQTGRNANKITGRKKDCRAGKFYIARQYATKSVCSYLNCALGTSNRQQWFQSRRRFLCTMYVYSYTSRIITGVEQLCGSMKGGTFLVKKMNVTLANMLLTQQ